MAESRAHPQNVNDVFKHSSSHGWNFGQNCHLVVGVTYIWEGVTAYIEGKQSNSQGMLLVHAH